MFENTFTTVRCAIPDMLANFGQFDWSILNILHLKTIVVLAF